MRRCFVLTIALVACSPASGEEATDDELGESGTQSESETESESGSEADTDDPFAAPDCEALMLAGDPFAVAETPRSDRDAEVLALSVEPSLIVAPQARYEQVSADLAAIRAIDPALEAVHTGCVFPNGFEVWWWESIEIPMAIFVGEYHGWDCHVGFYGLAQAVRIDGLAYAIAPDGVYGEGLRDEFAKIPGWESADMSGVWFPEPGLEGSLYSDECTSTHGEITLEATLDRDGGLVIRDYRFTPPEGEPVTWRVSPGEAPIQIE